ncbi:uncharacterized protein LOC134769706 [Penaeus indicus]|uniref:uncharacterized protein LOC134769706 n=1 Tax=Penaeus indicus TaxID=29960 RepID=UPI00300CC60E
MVPDVDDAGSYFWEWMLLLQFDLKRFQSACSNRHLFTPFTSSNSTGKWSLPCKSPMTCQVKSSCESATESARACAPLLTPTSSERLAKERDSLPPSVLRSGRLGREYRLLAMMHSLLKGMITIPLIVSVELAHLNLYKAFRGHRIQGTVSEMHEEASLLRCAHTCDKWKPSCRAFDFHLPTKNCRIFTSFRGTQRNTGYDLYFDFDIYQDLDYKDENGTLLYYPPLSRGPINFSSLTKYCQYRWGKVFLAKTMSEWQLMISIFQKTGYSNMWVPIKENKSDEGTYYWLDNKPAPGDLGITIKDDGGATEEMTLTDNGNYVYSNNIDCAMVYGDKTEEVQIVNCDNSYVGYICQAEFPAKIAVEEYPEH